MPKVQSDYIGTTKSGTGNLGDSDWGVFIDNGASGNQVGDTEASDGATNATTTIKGRLESTQNGTFTIQFFSNPTSTKDEGKKFMGETTVTDTDAIMPFTFFVRNPPGTSSSAERP